MTYFEGHVVKWSEHPSFLLPAEKLLTTGEMRRRAREAFKQREAEPDPKIRAQNVCTSISELEKIREVLINKD